MKKERTRVDFWFVHFGTTKGKFLSTLVTENFARLPPPTHRLSFDRSSKSLFYPFEISQQNLQNTQSIHQWNVEASQSTLMQQVATEAHTMHSCD